MSAAASAGGSMSWRARAACRGLDPELFHPGRGESMAEAQAVCCSCPVRVECAQWATYEGVEHHGIWGGLSERQRRRLRHRSASAGVSVGVGR